MGTGRTSGGPWTSHGHDIPGVTVDGPGRPERYRCGGTDHCPSCQVDAARIRGERERADGNR
jgi:hypothetical protein